MNQYFADLHIHIGRTMFGKPVKITGSKTLTLTNILKSAKFPKGLQIVGVIDCQSPEVLVEMKQLIEDEVLVPLDDGGFLYENEVTFIPGVEIEVMGENHKGLFHVLAYFPTYETISQFSDWLQQRVTNIHLSTQRMYEDVKVLQEKVKSLNGLFIPAHVFTPFKSLYGKAVEQSLKEVLNPEKIDAVELGLSSDTDMALNIKELHHYTFLTNSDAHSLQKIAREYQNFELEAPTFLNIGKALRNEDGNKIVANYGLNPLLGKYYQSTCAKCLKKWEGPVCAHCGSEKFTKGVSVRIQELANTKNIQTRPPYIHQIPLEFIPGLGKKTIGKLLDYFGTEMNILHKATEEQLTAIVKPPLAKAIISSREGKLTVAAGGGGKYGKIK